MEVFEKFDVNGDGRLSYSEFKRMMDKHNTAKMNKNTDVAQHTA